MVRRRSLVALATLAAGGSRTASGQGTEGPTTIIVPFTPGTGVDILARLIAPFLQNRFNQPFFVENRPGASGNIGTQAAARAAPDGRTLLLQANTFVMNPGLFRQVPYQPVDKIGCRAQRHKILRRKAPMRRYMLCLPWGGGILSTGCYDPVGSFAPIIRLTRGDLVLAVHPGVPAAPMPRPSRTSRAPVPWTTPAPATARRSTWAWSCSAWSRASP